MIFVLILVAIVAISFFAYITYKQSKEFGDLYYTTEYCASCRCVVSVCSSTQRCPYCGKHIDVTIKK